jgi:hypothetical protein
MSGCAGTARSFYLELRAAGLKLWVEDGPESCPLDYGIGMSVLRGLSDAHARSLRQRVLDNENELVEVLLDLRDPDLYAIRKEGYYG